MSGTRKLSASGREQFGTDAAADAVAIARRQNPFEVVLWSNWKLSPEATMALAAVGLYSKNASACGYHARAVGRQSR